ncbi:MAG: hypothetical protein R3348_08030 [Xanthomonadales bacterium]|nr:hypothetical protein [Xanthomonadales bacterium]
MQIESRTPELSARMRLLTISKMVGLLALVGILASGSVHAQYTYHLIEYPGADSTQLFGFNNSDQVVGSAAIPGEDGTAILYDIPSGEFSTIPGLSAAFGISNSGLLSGNVDDECAMVDKKGTITMLAPLPPEPDSFCNARGINSSGMVSGFDARPSGWTGFVYDSKNDQYTTFLQTASGALSTIAHGIDERGRIIGHTTFGLPDEVYPGSPAGNYGFVRKADGSLTFFRVDGEWTRGRDISENGQMTGWLIDFSSGFFASLVAWVADMPAAGGYTDIPLADAQILEPGPCNPDFVPPWPDYVSFTDVTPEAIRNDGVVVGICNEWFVQIDVNGNPINFERGPSVGFIAIPE